MDDPKKKEQDGKLVSKQPYEIDYLIKKTGRTEDEIKKAIDVVGHSREKVEDYLNNL